MNIVQLAKMVGKQVNVRVKMGGGNIHIACKIEDVKQAYGKIMYQVTPINGSGCVWIEEGSIVEDTKPKTKKVTDLEGII